MLSNIGSGGGAPAAAGAAPAAAAGGAAEPAAEEKKEEAKEGELSASTYCPGQWLTFESCSLQSPTTTWDSDFSTKRIVFSLYLYLSFLFPCFEIAARQSALVQHSPILATFM